MYRMQPTDFVLVSSVATLTSSMSLELNGKTIVSMAGYKLFWNNIRAQTGYSPQYVEKHGAESFLYPDAAQSTKYSSATATTGDGYSNNTAISTTFTAGTISATASVANDDFTKGLLSNPPNAGADSPPIYVVAVYWCCICHHYIANQLGRSAFVAGAGSLGAIMGTWNYMLKIKLTDLHPTFKELDLMANPQIRLRFRVNQGTSANIVDASRNMTLTGTTLSSGNVCHGNGCFCDQSKPNTDSFASAAVQEFQSPFDSAPWTLHPGSSMRNFNVRIGSQQTFDISHDYDFHHFTSEIAKIASINGDLTPELVNGLVDYQTWSLTNRVLIADVSRLTERDVPQAIQVQGVNAGVREPTCLYWL
ncbi:unnamed protein product [Phytophthora lilii]|uniref:Unnamed protein product n=1 Tax=Phytophthora lilii TaxID=2077276 RepID=A0A9W6TBE2_9STRA|nr:unnamed protein product [Phytophthora lilii]